MKKRIAVLLCGIAHTHPSNYDAVFGVFNRLRQLGIAVDYYTHYWSPDNIFPVDYDGPTELHIESIKQTQHIPVQDIQLQQRMTSYLRPHTAGSATSCFSEMWVDYYDDSEYPWVGYVNATAQFYALNKLMNTFNLYQYDFIFRWRYDILVNYELFIDEVLAALELDINEPSILTDHPRTMGGTDRLSNNDCWFGFNSAAIPVFQHIHSGVHAWICSSRPYAWVEEAFLEFIHAANLKRIERPARTMGPLICDRIVRSSVRVHPDFHTMGMQDQIETLDTIPYNDPPEHYVGGWYGD